MSLRPNGGLFITFEGPEGSGKSSQGRWLVQVLRRRDYSVVYVRDPGSTALGRALRRALLHTTTPLSSLAEALLFIGGRAQLVEERIAPALRRGRIVICDRFHDSTVVYQGFGGALNVAWLDRLGRAAIHHVMPSLTILLDVPTSIGFRRLRHAPDRMERKAMMFHRRVRQGYLQLARREPRRFVVVNASRPPAAVRAQLVAIVARHLKIRGPWSVVRGPHTTHAPRRTTSHTARVTM